MRVLVAGGAGFIGSHLSRALSDQGVECVAVDAYQWLWSKNISPFFQYSLEYRTQKLLSGIFCIRMNLCFDDNFALVLREVKPDVVVNLAALPLVSVAEQHPSEADRSVRGIAQALINACISDDSERTVRRFVHVSSSMVYGDFEMDPNPETALTRPKNVYGVAKLKSEEAVTNGLAGSGIEHVIVRPSAVYGPGDVNGRVVQLFCEGAVLGRPLKAHNPESTCLDFTWVEDLADGLAKAVLCEKAAGQTLNIASGTGRTLADAIEILRKLKPGVVVETGKPEGPTPPRRGGLDLSRAREILGFGDTTPLEEGMARYLSFLDARVH